MGLDPTTAVLPGSRPVGSADRADERVEVLRLAQEFEAMLMTQMLREMRRSMLDGEEGEGGLGAGAMQDTADVELGRSLTHQGGFGLTDVLLRAFERQVTPESGMEEGAEARVPGAPGAGIRFPVSHERFNLASNLTDAAPVSSKFGWRADPLTGAAKFHKGVDIAVAYGADVKAAAPGRVVFSGVQNGYGNTIVIDHEGGRQTRYAHLSEQAVQAGDAVAEGQVIGKSGNSGRTSGPHLHFELRVDGQPVDPAGD